MDNGADNDTGQERDVVVRAEGWLETGVSLRGELEARLAEVEAEAAKLRKMLDVLEAAMAAATSVTG